ncbi:hypothetical protein [Vibrio sp. D431a]|uniref:hypothetical protein n=1 Tax=Vibrio sp. D431a TaxID=2837388 RepID=UPI00255567BE|nr:hypothetical protein [Vibrio sp. D431a]MDK9793765.1 hypothetical protein [Vibrio sp. D431a]
MKILSRTETSLLGYHWQLEEIEQGQFWVARYLNGEFDDSTDKTSDKAKAERQFNARRGELPLVV